jgi:hypothetical protein
MTTYKESAVADLTKDDLKHAFLEALRSEEGQTIILEALVRKLEITAGWDCSNPEERSEIRKDQEFTRSLRLHAGQGIERFVWSVLGVGGTLFLAWIGAQHLSIWK